MRFKRFFLARKRCLLLWSGLLSFTVLLQYGIVVLTTDNKLSFQGKPGKSAKLDDTVIAKSKTCEIPSNSAFPLCSLKVETFHDSWNRKCHKEKHGVDPYNICSVLEYLSEVEAWCPVLPWRVDNDPFKPVNRTEAVIRTDVSELLAKLHDDRYAWNAWMRLRISEKWPQWREAVDELVAEQNLFNRKKKKILLYMGSLEATPGFFNNPFTGGCLGELTQWSDLICVLYTLGHDLIITSRRELPSIVTPPDSKGCPSRTLSDDIDLIFTDIVGANKIIDVSGSHQSRYRCKMRLLDTFGTDAHFNYREYEGDIPGGRTSWGDLDLQLPQFMTLFPHSPDNSFLGFAVPKNPTIKQTEAMQKKKINALVYGKRAPFWKGTTEYINMVKKYFHEVHANIGAENVEELHKNGIPDYVINHGVVNVSTLLGLFANSKLFVGLGFPFEGPAPIEALANGCFFINPKFDPPYDRVNHPFYKGKPMNRKITSQNPYAELLIGEPFVLTVDIKNMTEVEEALKKIASSSVIPHVPYEFTMKGMVERVNAYVEHQDFCKPSIWPPIEELKITMGQNGQSCEFACLNKALVCEPTFFTAINTEETLKGFGVPCDTFSSALLHNERILAPSIKASDNSCQLQNNSMLFSCRGAKPGVWRICPCRSYRKEQTALCESCF
ncbi:alpha-1,6-mannosylglycoprotein 6-beta-N-acetylglucosaminyltransferase A-like isoform X2 [Montipora capricornis]|uniref:alpha-1,6-mannosylglycoprotein 6-beta-N-acetylglucosaminyltransferase A-like isoform X2 n=1 Tax=Montipora capricornis TaxID=246305 RepID=UPI0035F10741